jgi:hypothetical protein
MMRWMLTIKATLLTSQILCARYHSLPVTCKICALSRWM